MITLLNQLVKINYKIGFTTGNIRERRKIMVNTDISSQLVTSYSNRSNDVTSGKKSVDSDFTKILNSQTAASNGNKIEADDSDKNNEIKSVIKKFYNDKSPVVKEEAKLEETDINNVAAEIYAQIINVIADVLDKQPEEVEDIMNELDINPEDLTESQSIVKIVSEIFEIDNPVNVLVDEDAMLAVKELNQEISEIINDFTGKFAIDEAEFKDLLGKIENVIQDNLSENIEQEADKIKETDTEDILDINDEVSVVSDEKDVLKSEENSQIEKNFNNDKDDNSEVYSGENGIENIISNIRDTITENISITEDGIADKIIKQITDDIRLYAKPDTTSLEIQLEPESLGKVGLTVTTKSGVVTAQLVVQNEVAKEAIESQMTTLKESLNGQDIKVEAIEVTIASKEFEQNLDRGKDSSEQDKNKRRKHISADELAEINGLPMDEEVVMENVLKDMGTTVNYSA